jgi:hypothetical protein
MSSGILYGVSSWMEECRDCGYKGSPVIFDSAEEYITFLKNLRKSKKDTASENIELSDNISGDNKECDDFLMDEGLHWHHGKWWMELLIAGLLGVLVSFSSVYRNVSIFGFEVGVIYSILEFIIFFIFILIGIIIIEYLIFLIVNRMRKKRG